MSAEPRFDRIEERIDRVEERQQRMETEQAETRVYVKQIFERIEDIRTMFASNGKSNDKWIDFAKWIIGGTIFIIVAYFFTGGS